MLIDPDVLGFTSQSPLHSIAIKEKGMRKKGTPFVSFTILKGSFLKATFCTVEQIIQFQMEQHLFHLFFFNFPNDWACILQAVGDIS